MVEQMKIWRLLIYIINILKKNVLHFKAYVEPCFMGLVKKWWYISIRQRNNSLSNGLTLKVMPKMVTYYFLSEKNFNELKFVMTMTRQKHYVTIWNGGEHYITPYLL